MASTEVIGDYVSMIQKMDPEVFGNQRALLIYFLTILETKKDFEISLDDICVEMRSLGFNKPKWNLKRLLVDKKEGRDFIIKRTQGATKPTDEVLMTRDCFKAFCIRMPNMIGHIIEKYFFLAEDRYREHAFDHIIRRRTQENPIITKNKNSEKNIHNRKKYQIGPSFYATQITNHMGNIIGFKEGSTRNENRREPEIEHLYSPFETKTAFHYLTDNDRYALEMCVNNATPSQERSKIDHEMVTSPLSEIEYRTKKCDKFLTQMRKEAEERYYSRHH